MSKLEEGRGSQPEDKILDKTKGKKQVNRAQEVDWYRLHVEMIAVNENYQTLLLKHTKCQDG